MKLPPDNLTYPVRIIIGNEFGSGFFLNRNKEVYLITARHVLFGHSAHEAPKLTANEARLICYGIVDKKVQTKPYILGANLEHLLANGSIKSHGSADICVLKLGIIKDSGEFAFTEGVSILQASDGTLIHYQMAGARMFDDVEISNDVFVLGYPASLSTANMDQIDYDAPLVRSGIVAGKNFKNRTIILDCPVYGGNSGGIIIEVNVDKQTTYHLIGVVVEFVPFVDIWENKRHPQLYNTHIQNSGYSIAVPVDRILEVIGL